MMTQVKTSVSPRPFIKWAGGKTQLISQYADYFPNQYLNYYEPFVGGGAIFFHLQPARSLLIDINLELVNVYRCVRDQVDELIDRLDHHHQRHSAEHYYQVRSQLAVSDDWFYAGNHVERAARLIYLNKTCFNGLYRENSKGHFNVPLGSYKNPAIYDPEILRADAIALRSARIEPGSFEQVLHHARGPEDFIYFDPPYYPISPTSSFTAYNRYAFNEEKQVQLRDVVAELSDRGVKVMLSNSDCEYVRELYKDFHIHTIYATRNINCNAEKRGRITEVLVTTY